MDFFAKLLKEISFEIKEPRISNGLWPWVCHLAANFSFIYSVVMFFVASYDIVSNIYFNATTMLTNEPVNEQTFAFSFKFKQQHSTRPNDFYQRRQRVPSAHYRDKGTLDDE